MKQDYAHWDERTFDLAVEEVTCGLATSELEELLSRVDRLDLAHLERAAAALSLAGLETLEAPPAAIMRHVQAEARSRYAYAAPRNVAPSPRSSNWIAWTGWAAAAVILMAFVFRGLTLRAKDAVAGREELVATAGDLVRAPWKATGDPLALTVGGDVVWSSARQEGYMRFRDLPANDPTKLQYQLWIFDKTRAEWDAKPVDGGVFDVIPGGEVVVPIHAKLAVRDAQLFGVTVEVPGGVVVSKREHLVATASP
ncbi:MAG: anti-sigma factor [Planctomycetota bacterium]|nr:anti-sigma factor [Planctomycetota bacterium]